MSVSLKDLNFEDEVDLDGESLYFDFTCPLAECSRKFETAKGLTTHIGMKHKKEVILSK